MSRVSYRGVVIVATLLATHPLGAQSTQNQAVRIAIGSFLRTNYLEKLNVYRDRLVLLDTTRLSVMYDGSEWIRPDTRMPLVYSAAATKALAVAANLQIAQQGQLIRCKHPVFECTPDSTAIIQIGEPNIVGDTAYVLFHTAWTTGNNSMTEVRRAQLLVKLHLSANGWHAVEVRDAKGTKPGAKPIPVPGLSAN